MGTNNYTVAVEGLVKEYNEVTALNNISFSVNKGELFGVIGPDGAGKTSLFRIITSLLLPSKGKVSVLKYDCVRDYKHIRKIIGYMPGKFSLYQDLSVEENLQFFATVFGTTIAENYDLVKDIYSQLEPFKGRLAGQLSGGMKQKLALSCALIHKPDLLILDEPTTGVDAVSRKEFWEMLKRLKNLGITILVSTPYMDEASLCDRIMLMEKGEVLQISTPELIRAAYPDTLYAVKADSMYLLKKFLEQYEHTQSVFLFGQYLHYVDKRDQITANELKTAFQNKGHKQLEIHETPATIEDVFIQLSNT